jgi:small-conductance mechanosensitive channel
MTDFLSTALSQQFLLLFITKCIKIAFVIIIALFFYNVLKRIIGRVIDMHFEELSMTQRRRANTLLSLVRSFLAVIFSFITIMMILNELSIDTTSLLAGASIIGLAIGVGAQGLVKDFGAGIFIILEDQYSIGDIVTIKGFTGTVTDVSLRTTKVCSNDKVVHTIPNGLIDIVSNYTKGIYIATIKISISQDADPDVVLPVLKRALDEVGRRSDVQSEGASVGGISSMEGNSLTYEVSIPARRIDSYDVCAAYRYTAAKMLAAAHIPFAKFSVEADLYPKKDDGKSSDNVKQEA